MNSFKQYVNNYHLDVLICYCTVYYIFHKKGGSIMSLPYKIQMLINSKGGFILLRESSLKIWTLKGMHTPTNRTLHFAMEDQAQERVFSLYEKAPWALLSSCTTDLTLYVTNSKKRSLNLSTRNAQEQYTENFAKSITPCIWTEDLTLLGTGSNVRYYSPNFTWPKKCHSIGEYKKKLPQQGPRLIDWFR